MSQDYSDESEFNQQQQYDPADQELPFLGVNFVQQVDELVSLAHYGPSIVLVIGEDGIGKSCIAEQLENETSEIGQIRIDGNPMLGIDQLHASFLQQLNNYEQAVEFNSVRDSLQRAAEVVEQLIIVDDAQQLSTSVLESLISLVSPIEQSPSIPVRLFLFGNDDLMQQLNKDSFPASAVYCLNLKGFERDEIATFVGHQLNLSDAEIEQSLGKKILSSLWKDTNGNPARIIHNLEQQEVEENDDDHENTVVTETKGASIIFRGLLTLLGVALLLLAIFGEKWLQNDEPEDLKVVKEIPLNTEVKEQIPLAVEVAEKELKVEPITETGFTQEQSLATVELGESLVVDAKPDVLETRSETIVDKRVEKRIETNELDLVPTEVKEDAVLVVEEKLSKTSVAVAEELIPQADTTVDTELSVAEAVVEALVEEKPQQQKTDAITYSDDEQFLLIQPSNNYSIQLVGLSNLEEMEKFVSTLQAKQAVYIYRSLLNGKPWFILVTGSYPDADTARISKQQLQPSMTKLKPFIKSMAAIQKQARQAGESR